MQLNLWLALAGLLLFIIGYLVGTLCERAWIKADTIATQKENEFLRGELELLSMQNLGYRVLLDRKGKLHPTEPSRN